jgi:chromosome segregation ATPase
MDEMRAEADEPRFCGYSACQRPLPSEPTGGRLPGYCPDRKWDGVSCREMAKRERRRLRAAALEAPLAVYERATTKLVAGLDGFAALAAEVTAAAQDVTGGALARIQHEEETARNATDRADRAGERERRARRAQAVAEAAARESDREARKSDARRQALQREMEEKVAAAWKATAEHEAARGAAQSRLAEIERVNEALTEASQTLTDQVTSLRDEARQLGEQLAAAVANETTATHERGRALKLAEQRAVEVRQARATAARAQGRENAVREELVVVRGQLEQANAKADGQRSRADEAETALASARARIKGLDAELVAERETTARLRAELDQLAAELKQIQGRTVTVEQLRAMLAGQGGEGESEHEGQGR